MDDARARVSEDTLQPLDRRAGERGLARTIGTQEDQEGSGRREQRPDPNRVREFEQRQQRTQRAPNERAHESRAPHSSAECRDSAIPNRLEKRRSRSLPQDVPGYLMEPCGVVAQLFSSTGHRVGRRHGGARQGPEEVDEHRVCRCEARQAPREPLDPRARRRSERARRTRLPTCADRVPGTPRGPPRSSTGRGIARGTRIGGARRFALPKPGTRRSGALQSAASHRARRSSPRRPSDLRRADAVHARLRRPDRCRPIEPRAHWRGPKHPEAHHSGGSTRSRQFHPRPATIQNNVRPTSATSPQKLAFATYSRLSWCLRS